MELYLTYEEYRTGGEVCAGQENESWPSYEDEHVHFTPLKVYLESTDVPSWQKETFTADADLKRGDTVHLVIVRYGDGGTFGMTYGYWKIMAAYTNYEDAVKLCKEIPSGEWKELPGLGPSAYACWEGYFSSFDGVDVHTFVVE